MLVSWNWLKEYVALEMPREELHERLALSGLNFEGGFASGEDWTIDLEVTSNRPDCLGHVGVAREIAVLWDLPLEIPQPKLRAGKTATEELAQVSVEAEDLCSRYIGRVIQGVQVGPSPEWLVKRLEAVKINPVNNVVDVTNYVMFECGQPLHAFDLQKLSGGQVVVRRARKGETLEAINHKTYELTADNCVIADAEKPVALAGVMGGADSEVGEDTVDLFIESAQFAQLAVRSAARQFNLHSPSSHRFERTTDPKGVDWASRRCCELILELAGGKLAKGTVEVSPEISPPAPVVLRLSQIPRVLGVDIPTDELKRIFAALGCKEQKAAADKIKVVPPTWRRDLTREIDLVEEAARIHGYDKIPEDVGVPMAPSHRSREDRVLDQVRRVLTAAGFDESLTPSLAPEAWSEFNPWNSASSPVSSAPMKGVASSAGPADRLRCSLAPSLLEARRINESLSNPVVELFETARVYLTGKKPALREQQNLAITSGGDFFALKGVVQALLDALHISSELHIEKASLGWLDPVKVCRLKLNGEDLGYLGEIAAETVKRFRLRTGAALAELNMQVLTEASELIPQHADQSPFPATTRDVNLIVEESVRWADLAMVIDQSAGEWLEAVSYQETYRNAKQDGPGKKRLLFTLTLRSAEGTLTGEQADEVHKRVVEACQKKHQAQLVG